MSEPISPVSIDWEAFAKNGGTYREAAKMLGKEIYNTKNMLKKLDRKIADKIAMNGQLAQRRSCRFNPIPKMKKDIPTTAMLMKTGGYTDGN